MLVNQVGEFVCKSEVPTPERISSIHENPRSIRMIRTREPRKLAAWNRELENPYAADCQTSPKVSYWFAIGTEKLPDAVSKLDSAFARSDSRNLNSSLSIKELVQLVRLPAQFLKSRGDDTSF